MSDCPRHRARAVRRAPPRRDRPADHALGRAGDAPAPAAGHVVRRRAPAAGLGHGRDDVRRGRGRAGRLPDRRRPGGLRLRLPRRLRRSAPWGWSATRCCSLPEGKDRQLDEGDEGCLSYPGAFVECARPDSATVRAPAWTGSRWSSPATDAGPLPPARDRPHPRHGLRRPAAHQAAQEAPEVDGAGRRGLPARLAGAERRSAHCGGASVVRRALAARPPWPAGDLAAPISSCARSCAVDDTRARFRSDAATRHAWPAPGRAAPVVEQSPATSPGVPGTCPEAATPRGSARRPGGGRHASARCRGAARASDSACRGRA